MPTNKCIVCIKPITRKCPGVECNKCLRLVHANNECAGLTNKQIQSLRAADGLKWICETCEKKSPGKSSIVVPSEEEDEDDDVEVPKGVKMMMQKLLKDIAKDIEKNIKKELTSVMSSIEFLSEKMEEFTESVEAFKTKMKELEKRNTNLANHNTYLETKMKSLEQRVQDVEQTQLSKHIEVAGIPQTEEGNLTQVVERVAKKLEVNANTIKTVKRIGARAGQAGPLLVELADAGERETWLRRARDVNIVVADAVPDAAAEVAGAKVFIRGALTYFNKTLLWKAKEQLRNTHQYVWFKDGKVLARKVFNSKVLTLRSEEDIKKAVPTINS